MLLIIIIFVVLILLAFFLTRKVMGSIYKYIALLGVIIIFSLMLTNKVTVFTAPFYCYKSETFLRTQYEQMYSSYNGTEDFENLRNQLNDTRGNLGLLKIASEKTIIGKQGYQKLYDELVSIDKQITEIDKSDKDKVRNDLKSAISLLGGKVDEQ